MLGVLFTVWPVGTQSLIKKLLPKARVAVSNVRLSSGPCGSGSRAAGASGPPGQPLSSAHASPTLRTRCSAPSRRPEAGPSGRAPRGPEGRVATSACMLTAQSRRTGREAASQLSEQGQQPIRTPARRGGKPDEGLPRLPSLAAQPLTSGPIPDWGHGEKALPPPPPSSVAHHG